MIKCRIFMNHSINIKKMNFNTLVLFTLSYNQMCKKKQTRDSPSNNLARDSISLFYFLVLIVFFLILVLHLLFIN